MQKLFKLALILGCCLIFLTGCPGSSKENVALKYKLTVTEKSGPSMLSGFPVGGLEEFAQVEEVSTPQVFEYLSVGLTVYTGGGATVTVKEITDEEIKLSFDGATFIELAADGSVNLKAQSVKVLTVKRGELKQIMTEKMTAGTSVTFKYEAK